MLTTGQDVLIVLASVTGALLFLWVLERLWPCAQRRLHNDIIGWQVTVLGTTYAVIIGFMLYAVWNTFQTAEINADNEANALVNIYRLSDGLPEAQRVQVHAIAREYADTVIRQEWPTMQRGEYSLAGHGLIEKLWATVSQIKPVTAGEQASMSLTLGEISTMTRFRRMRQLSSESQLPGILWLLMILGAIVTTLSSCLFGTENFRLHMVQVFSLTLVTSLTLVAIADIDRPFQGRVHVRPSGFERAQYTFLHSNL